MPQFPIPVVPSTLDDTLTITVSTLAAMYLAAHASEILGDGGREDIVDAALDRFVQTVGNALLARITDTGNQTDTGL